MTTGSVLESRRVVSVGVDEQALFGSIDKINGLIVAAGAAQRREEARLPTEARDLGQQRDLIPLASGEEQDERFGLAAVQRAEVYRRIETADRQEIGRASCGFDGALDPSPHDTERPSQPQGFRFPPQGIAGHPRLIVQITLQLGRIEAPRRAGEPADLLGEGLTRQIDQILVLDNGVIVERGTHRELLALGGRYRQLYDKQYGVEKDRFVNPGEELRPDGLMVAESR